MKLSVKERIKLIELLPKTGDIIDIKIISEFRMKIGFTNKEIVDWKITSTPSEYDNMIHYDWDDKKVKDVKFEIGNRIVGVVTNQLKDMNANRTLDESLISLWDKFMEEEK